MNQLFILMSLWKICYTFPFFFFYSTTDSWVQWWKNCKEECLWMMYFTGWSKRFLGTIFLKHRVSSDLPHPLQYVGGGGNNPEFFFASNFYNCANPKTVTRFCSFMAVVNQMMVLFWFLHNGGKQRKTFVWQPTFDYEAGMLTTSHHYYTIRRRINNCVPVHYLVLVHIYIRVHTYIYVYRPR
jgi:hypothetical protein